ncbi:MAG: hypothetical protein ACFFDH_20055 [Promethearchaeota archaeon]
MTLDSDIILNGVLSLLLVTGFFIVGFSILLKYRQNKNYLFILTGIAWIGISEPWWPSSISFIFALFNDTGLNTFSYVIINNIFLPIFLLLWIIVIINLVEIQKKNLIIALYSASAIILELLVIYFLINDISMVGTLLSPVDLDFGLVTTIFVVYTLVIFIVTGLIFAIKTIKIGDKDSKLRGWFLLMAFLIFLIGAIFEIVITFPINRIVILLSAIIFYIGFIMPDAIKNLLLKS